ncbi:MAG: hypothetical protein GF349_01320 [Candidatus Magasanikbacteria bacterium]|nr:hypothetical protein [Candidatus Magasanikbacteria bacterium]
MKIIKISLIVVIVVLGLFISYRSIRGSTESGEELSRAAGTVMVYKSPDCGCCVNHIAYLRRHGFEVGVVEMNNMPSVKKKFGVTRELESCHTSVFGDYVVEGHVPIEAINKLLTEQPDISGIALPEMPPGSPGMPGIKRAPFVIYTLGKEKDEFIKI